MGKQTAAIGVTQFPVKMLCVLIRLSRGHDAGKAVGCHAGFPVCDKPGAESEPPVRFQQKQQIQKRDAVPEQVPTEPAGELSVGFKQQNPSARERGGKPAEPDMAVVFRQRAEIRRDSGTDHGSRHVQSCSSLASRVIRA